MALFPSMANVHSAMKFDEWTAEVKNLKRPQEHRAIGCSVFTGTVETEFQRYGSTRRMLMRSEIPGRSSIVMVPLT